MADIVIAEAVRSAVGRAHKGSLALKRPDELAGDVIKGLLQRVPQVTPDMVDDLILGCAMPEGEQGLNMARLAGLLGGLPNESSAVTINRFCSSGLQAMARACVQLRLPAGGARVRVGAVAAPGVERRVLHVRSRSRWAPVCIGPYAQANSLAGAGGGAGLTFVAGQIALDPPTMRLSHRASPVDQLRLALRHCAAIATCQGARAEDALAVLVYAAGSVELGAELLDAELPAGAPWLLVRVPRLPRDAAVEVELLTCAAGAPAREGARSRVEAAPDSSWSGWAAAELRCSAAAEEDAALEAAPEGFVTGRLLFDAARPGAAARAEALAARLGAAALPADALSSRGGAQSLAALFVAAHAP